MRLVPSARVFSRNRAPVREQGEYVVYWMMAARRTRWNFGLQRALELGMELGKPVVVFEALRVGYRWASERHHTFVLQGMAENAARLENTPVGYIPYVEPTAGEGRGLLDHLASRACAVVTDDYPAFFLPRAVEAAARRLGVRVEAVDSNGIFPMRATDRVFTTAHSFRAFLQKQLPHYLGDFPRPDPLEGLELPRFDLDPLHGSRWTAYDPAGDPYACAQILPIDHEVGAVDLVGGSEAAEATLAGFLEDRLPRYGASRNDVEDEAASGLSPYLHFGMISAHEVVQAVLEGDGWNPGRLGSDTRGSRQGWWGLSETRESFLDELITWRELGFNMCALRPDDYAEYSSLPAWSRATLEQHAQDPRPYRYTCEELEAAATHDPVWNAAQRQLVRTGRVHNYLRMLWGKKILEWTGSPREALEVLLHLNNRWALDGRDPNSYSGVFWTLGRYDRAWGPERPIFGKVRFMSSDSTRRKLRLHRYLEIFGPDEGPVQAALSFG